MKYNLALPDEFNSHFEIRNDAGMNIGIAFQNEHPFDGCKPVTMEDAENNARLWAAADDMLRALEEINNDYSYSNKRVSDKAIDMVHAAINKAKGL